MILQRTSPLGMLIPVVIIITVSFCMGYILGRVDTQQDKLALDLPPASLGVAGCDSVAAFRLQYDPESAPHIYCFGSKEGDTYHVTYTDQQRMNVTKKRIVLAIQQDLNDMTGGRQP